MTAVAPALTLLQREYRRLDLLRLERIGLDTKIAAAERRIAQLEAQEVSVPMPEESPGDLTAPNEVSRRVRELKERLCNPGGG